MSWGALSTTDEVLGDLDLSGQVAVITGASGGIGAETARSLAAHGARVVIAARDHAKTAQAIETIHVAHPDAQVSSVVLDLGSLASARRAAEQIAHTHDRLDMLINNAGVMCTPFGRTADGFETQFGTNHVGHFVFTDRLVALLTATNGARVVNLSSAGHGMGSVDLDDPNFERRPYDPWVAYGQSKTANVLFSVELDRRLRDQGVRSFAVHPGGIRTELGRYMTGDDVAVLMQRIAEAAPPGGGAMVWKSTAQGAATSVWAATSADLDGQGGLYLEDCTIAERRAPDAPSTAAGVMPYAIDPSIATALWDLSERLVAAAG
jgi:NAD(P)-dependent dehydrogenase (short-subunit alcohol dehydrogenase family)